MAVDGDHATALLAHGDRDVERLDDVLRRGDVGAAKPGADLEFGPCLAIVEHAQELEGVGRVGTRCLLVRREHPVGGFADLLPDSARLHPGGEHGVVDRDAIQHRRFESAADERAGYRFVPYQTPWWQAAFLMRPSTRNTPSV